MTISIPRPDGKNCSTEGCSYWVSHFVLSCHRQPVINHKLSMVMFSVVFVNKLSERQQVRLLSNSKTKSLVLYRHFMDFQCHQPFCRPYLKTWFAPPNLKGQLTKLTTLCLTTVATSQLSTGLVTLNHEFVSWQNDNLTKSHHANLGIIWVEYFFNQHKTCLKVHFQVSIRQSVFTFRLWNEH